MITADPLLLTPQEAAERLGISLRTLSRMRGEQRLKWVQVTRRKWMVRASDIEAFVEANTHGGEYLGISAMRVTSMSRSARPTHIVPFSKLTR